jgi:integrase
LRNKVPKVKDFINQSFSDGIFSPSEICRNYNEKYQTKERKPKTVDAFEKAIRRMGINKDQRIEMAHQNGASSTKDIEEYPEVKRYLLSGDMQNITNKQKKRTLADLKALYNLMGRSDPHTWKFEELAECMIKNVGKTERGNEWKQPHRVRNLLGSFNRCFQGILPKGWSMGLSGNLGEHKDFWEVEEFKRFIEGQEDTKHLSREGWQCLFSQQIERGCREGIDEKTGILSATWEQINYETRRTDQIDKGEKGHSQRLWVQVPCDLFNFWLNSWELLVKYHKQVFGYEPTQVHHGTGRMFLTYYEAYRQQFNKIRKKVGIIGKKKNSPHILRMTHGQWCKRIGVSLENLCGDCSSTPSIGRYGVGWTDPKIPLKFYLTKEAYEYEEQDQIIVQRLQKQGILSFNTPLQQIPMIANS